MNPIIPWSPGQCVRIILGPFQGRYGTIVGQYKETWRWIRVEVDGEVAHWFKPGELAPVPHPTHTV